MSLQTLVIDDEKAFGEMMALVLQKEGYSVTVVDSAEQGLEHLETHATDLVLCDLHMPGMDRMGFLRAARERGLECTTIMMSAYGTPAAALEAMKLGAYDYISKPFNRDEIILVLRKQRKESDFGRKIALFGSLQVMASSWGIGENAGSPGNH